MKQEGWKHTTSSVGSKCYKHQHCSICHPKIKNLSTKNRRKGKSFLALDYCRKCGKTVDGNTGYTCDDCESTYCLSCKHICVTDYRYHGHK